MSDQAVTIQPVEIMVEQQHLKGQLYVPATILNKPAVLLLHGWTGRPNDRAALVFAKQGFVTLVFSMRGHNDSDGDIQQVSRRDSLTDAIAAYDYLCSQVPEGTNIVAIGNSYGGYIAALLSTTRQLFALSIRVPAAYPDEGFNEPQFGKGHEDSGISQWRLTRQDHKGNRGFAAIHDFSGPIQIIEAELDEVVPHQSIENYLRAASDPAKVESQLVRGWPHSLGDDLKRNIDYQTMILDWLSTLTEV